MMAGRPGPLRRASPEGGTSAAAEGSPDGRGSLVVERGRPRLVVGAPRGTSSRISDRPGARLDAGSRFGLMLGPLPT
jgi:hypothetical protein